MGKNRVLLNLLCVLTLIPDVLQQYLKVIILSVTLKTCHWAFVRLWMCVMGQVTEGLACDWPFRMELSVGEVVELKRLLRSEDIALNLGRV